MSWDGQGTRYLRHVMFGVYSQGTGDDGDLVRIPINQALRHTLSLPLSLPPSLRP